MRKSEVAHKCLDCDKTVRMTASPRCRSCSMKYKRKYVYWASFKGHVMTDEQKKKLSNTRISSGVAKGDKNPAWNSFKLSYPLIRTIRTCNKYFEWRNQVLRRDNYTCVKCSHVGRPLEAHHIKPFKQIFEEFLKLYDQFSPVEDKSTLFRLAEKYDDFWKIEHGETQCKNCHSLTKGLKA